MALLEVKDLEVSYGLIKAIRGVSFEVNEGEIVALIGANGAGKTTIMHAVNGLIPKKAGKVCFAGKDITDTPAHKLTSMGIAQVPEGRRIFQELTVFQNLQLGAYTRSDRKEFDESLEDIYNRFPILKERSKQIAGTLSGGEQQRVAIARALAKKPKLLLCDEPTGALDYNTGKMILKLLQDTCRSENMTVILVTHNTAICPMADRVIHMKSSKVSEIVVNEHPTPVEEIEW